MRSCVAYGEQSFAREREFRGLVVAVVVLTPLHCSDLKMVNAAKLVLHVFYHNFESISKINIKKSQNWDPTPVYTVQKNKTSFDDFFQGKSKLK